MGRGTAEGTRGFPYGPYPAGWFQVAWSDELSQGDVRGLHYFGVDLVAYRNASGTAVVADGHCPHLGAHLGVGGTVDGDCLVCPFHGWRWAPDGSNDAVPYGRGHSASRLKVWPVCERNGMVLVWHDPDGGPPTWQPPVLPEHDDPSYLPGWPDAVGVFAGARTIPQFIVENAVDFAHQQYVHGAVSPSRVLSYEADGPFYRAVQSIVFGGRRASTWLTPDGAVESRMEVEVWGPGIIIAHFPGTDEAAHVQAQTPVDPGSCDIRVMVLVRRVPGADAAVSEGTKRRIAHEMRQVANDLPIWEHMRWVPKPPFPPEEAKPYRHFRAWCAQFYPSWRRAHASSNNANDR